MEARHLQKACFDIFWNTSSQYAGLDFPCPLRCCYGIFVSSLGEEELEPKRFTKRRRKKTLAGVMEATRFGERSVRGGFRDGISLLGHVYGTPGLDTGDLFTQATYPHSKSSGSRWNQSMAIEVRDVCVVDRAERERVFSVSFLPSGSWLVGAAGAGANVGGEHQMLKWSYSDISNVAGEIALLGGLGLWAATFPRIRRNFFELFFYTHHLYIIFVFFFVLHVGIGFTFIALPGFYLFMIDRYLRFLQSRSSVRLLSARVLPCHVVELNFAKSHGLTYNPTSIMFVNVPSISKLQWHPFTVSSNSNLEADKLSVIIKCEGNWSTKLDRMLSSSIERLDVSIEGPYGPASNHFLRHDTIVMVSGGSGITPFISIIRELIFRSKLSECKIPDIILISIFKRSLDLTMLDLLLPMTGSPSELSNLKLQIEAYVTKENEPATDNSKRVRSVWFKPLPTDKPMAAILGPNSWLWLGAIISSSFIMFLILIGIINRFYIYPKDHNKNEFSNSIQAVMNILAICVSIAATASAAVFWNKRRYAREAMQVKNMEAQTPDGSPNMMAYNGERELESLPHQSLAEATKIHYGGRPDLRRLIFECKGASIGVLASGPTTLRHDVATICSSGLADNLHFESISFSW
ncbi:hypothetical protein V6N13_020865 [Hibiscus sabdariffa]